MPNKTPRLLKVAILQVAEGASAQNGVVGYLRAQSIANPQAFLPFRGKELPMTVAGDPDRPRAIDMKLNTRRKLASRLDAIAGRSGEVTLGAVRTH